MTRKQALNKVYSYIKDNMDDSVEKNTILEKIQECVDELPYAQWSEKAILDACQQWLDDHPGNNLPLSAGHMRGRFKLPSHKTVQNRMKMSMREFRDKYFPPKYPDWHDKYTIDEWKKIFIDEFNRIKAVSLEDYDNRRDRTIAPSIHSLKKILNVDSGTKLLEICNLCNFSKNKKHNIYIVSSSSKLFDKYEELNKRS